MCVRICVCVYVYVYMCTRVCACVDVCMYIYICIWQYSDYLLIDSHCEHVYLFFINTIARPFLHSQ